MSDNYSNDVKADPKHMEDIAKTDLPYGGHGDGVVEFPAALSNFPEAPTLEMVKAGLAILAQEQSRSTFATLAADWYQILLTVPYLIACMGQGFDSGAAGISGAMPAFLIKFGEFDAITHAPSIASKWLSLWSGMLSLGLAIGSGISGPLIDRYGPRKVTFGFSVFMMGAVAIQVTSVNPEMLLAGKLLAGIPMGSFLTTTNNYISESTGTRIRGPASSLLLMSLTAGIVFGLTTGYKRIMFIDDGWGSWRLLFAMQWIFPAVTAALLPFTADSPAFYVKRGQPAIARKHIAKIFRLTDESTIRARLATIQQTIAIEQENIVSSGTATWGDLFATPSDRARTFTSLGLWVAYSFGGASFLANGIYFLSQQDIPITTIFAVTLCMISLGSLVALFSAWAMEAWGRRFCFVYGNMLHFLVLLILGCLGYASGTAAGWGLSILINLGISTQGFATNSPSYALMNELSSIRLRAKTQAASLIVSAVFQCAFSFITPYIFQAPGNLGAKTGFVFAGLTVLVIVWSYFYVPETRKRSAAEIDSLYEHGISPRQFANTDIATLGHQHAVVH